MRIPEFYGRRAVFGNGRRVPDLENRVVVESTTTAPRFFLESSQKVSVRSPNMLESTYSNHSFMTKLSPAEQVLHKQFSDYGRNAREWMRKCVLLLPEIDRRQIWRKKRCSSIYEYAAKLAGMRHATVDEALRVLKKIEDKPALLELVKERGFQRVRPVASIATLETESFWAEKARIMSKHALETYVKDFRLEFLPGEENRSVKLQMELEPELAMKLEKLKGLGTWSELMKKLVDGVQKVEVAVPEPVYTESRHIPVAMQAYVEERTRGLCAAPHCTRPATSFHHTQRWALEKVHDPARLQPVCTAHERLAHLGLIENEECAPDEWRLRKEPDRTDPKFYVDTLVSLYRSP